MNKIRYLWKYLALSFVAMMIGGTVGYFWGSADGYFSAVSEINRDSALILERANAGDIAAVEFTLACQALPKDQLGMLFSKWMWPLNKFSVEAVDMLLMPFNTESC